MADVNANIDINIDSSNAISQLKSLQRQISQFHTSIAKSSESAALAQRGLEKNLLNSINSIGSFSAELRTVKTTAESFTTALEGNKFSMREYFRYAGGSTKTFGKLFRSEFDTIGKVAEERVKKLQTQYIKMGRDSTGAMKAIAVMPKSLDMSDYNTKIQVGAQKQALFNQLMKQGSTNLLNFGKNTQWAGRQLMVGFTIPLTILGSTAAKTFMEMEAQALKFKKVYGDLFTPQAETQAALDGITELGQMFTKYGVAVSSTVGLAAEAAAAGFQGLDLQRQTTEATRLSILGQIENSKALETTISLQNAFGMSSDKLADSINFLNAVENQTVVSLDDITTAIPKVAPVIQQLGGDVKDLTFFIAAMKEGGINASEGANALKSGLAALINPTKKANEMLSQFGINAREIVVKNKGNLKATVVEFATALNQLDPLNRAQAIEQMFGKFQFARLSTLFANVAKDGNQASRVLDLANSSVEELSALSERELGMTAESSMNKFKKAVEDLKFALIPVGKAFLEAVTPIAEFVGNILSKFNDLSAGSKKAITLLVTVIGGLGPVLLMTFGLLANGVANIIKLFLTLRQGYQRLTGQSQVLGEQTQYLTMEQLDAAAVAHSLDQAHARLTQRFTLEAEALNKLIIAYQSAATAGQRFAMNNPGMMLPPRAPRKLAGGIVSVPGSGNKDTVPAMLAPGEAVIPSKFAKKYAPLIQGMVAGNIPGYMSGLAPAYAHAQMPFSPGSQQYQEGIKIAGLEQLAAEFPQFIKVVSNLVAELPQSLNVAMKKGASVGEFTKEYGSREGKFTTAAQLGGLDIGNTENKKALQLLENQIGKATVQLAEQKAAGGKVVVSDEMFAEATRSVIDEYKNIEGAAGRAARALDASSKQIGQVRVSAKKDEILSGLKSGKFVKTKTGKQTQNQVMFGDVNVGRESVSHPGQYQSGNPISPRGSYKGKKKQGLIFAAKEDAKAYQSEVEKNTTDIYPATRERTSPHRLASADGKDDANAYESAKQTATKQRRRSDRPQGPPSIGLGAIGPGATISPAGLESVVNETRARQTATEKLGKLNGAIMGGTFALTSLASAGSMASGPLGDLSQQVMKYSGLLFGLMSITQLLTQAKVTELVATRAGTVATAMGGTGFKALFSKGGGLAGFGKNLLTAGKFLLRFLGPIGLVTTGLLAAYSVIKMVNAARERERLSIEGLGDAAFLAKDKLKMLGGFFNVVPTASPFSSKTPQMGTTPAQRSQVESLRGDKDFKSKFKNDIKSLKSATDKQAQLVFNSLAIQLKGQGFTKEAIDTIVKALQEEAGKTSIKFDFSSIDISTKEGMSGFQKSLDDLSAQVAKDFATGYSASTRLAMNGATGMWESFTTNIMSDKLKTSINLATKSFTGMIDGISGQLANGTITADQYSQSFARISSKLAAMPKPVQLAIVAELLKSLPEPVAKTATALTNIGDTMLLVNAKAMGLTEGLAGVASAMLFLQTATGWGPEFAKNVNAAKLVISNFKKQLDDLKKGLGLTTKETDPFKDLGTGEKFDFSKYISNNIKAIQTQTKAYEAMRLAGISAATAAELASNSDAAKAIVELAKVGGDAWKKATNEIKKYTKEQKILQTGLIAGAESGDYELGRLQMAEKFITLQENLLNLQTSPKIKKYNDELSFQELILKKISDAMDAVTNKEITPRETLIKQNNYKLEELSLIENEINSAYDDQIKALDAIEKSNKNINAMQRSKLSIADALTQGDISAAAKAVDEARAEQSVNSLSNTQEQITISKDLTIAALGRKQIEEENKILQFQISQIQKNQLDAMEMAKTQVDKRIDALNYEVSITEKLLQLQKDSIKYFGMTKTEIDNAISSLNLAKDAGIDINVTSNLEVFLKAAKGDTEALNTLLTTTVPASAKAAFDALVTLRNSMNLSSTITVSVAGDGAVTSISAVTAAWAALNTAADSAAKARIIMAQFQIDQLSFNDFIAKTDEIDAKIKQMLKDAADILKDGIITDAELAAFATKWGLALEQAQTFLDNVNAIFKAAVIDKSAIEAFAKEWGIPYAAAVKYLTDANAYLLVGTIDDTTIKSFATKWSLPYEAVKQYLLDSNKSLSETGLDSTSITEYAAKWEEPKTAFNSYTSAVITGISTLSTLDYSSPGSSASSAWNGATAAANAYSIAAAAASTAQKELASAIAATQAAATAAAIAAAKVLTDAAAAAAVASVNTKTVGNTADSSGGSGSTTKYTSNGVAFKTADHAKQANDLYLALKAAITAYDAQNKLGPSTKLGTLLTAKNTAQKQYDNFVTKYKYAASGGLVSKYMASGGIVPKYMASGGMASPKYFAAGGVPRGTDTIPAMLTPGEFVMSKYAVDSYGVDKMKAINSGSIEGDKVYNYNLSVNVKSNANPQDIAKTVMLEIKNVDSQRIRTQR